MALALRAGGVHIILSLPWLLGYYWFGHKANTGKRSACSSCTTMSMSVSTSVTKFLCEYRRRCRCHCQPPLCPQPFVRCSCDAQNLHGTITQYFRFHFYSSFLFPFPLGIVQYLQFGYQKGLLYRLKALGERHNMDITIEGFHSWMWRGLSFLLPFLFFGYAFQAYNAWTLYHLMFNPAGAPWHVSNVWLPKGKKEGSGRQKKNEC